MDGHKKDSEGVDERERRKTLKEEEKRKTLKGWTRKREERH